MADLDVNGTTLFIRERGEGPTALFLAGFIIDSTLWMEQMEALADVRRCVGVDLRGFGLSVAVPMRVLDLDQYVTDVEQAAEQLGPDGVDLVGFSLSAVVGLMLAERRPDLVRSLTMISPNLGADDLPYRRYRDEMARLVVREGKDALYRRFSEYIVAGGASLHALARYRQMMESTRVDMIVTTLESAGRMPDRTAILPKVTVPAMLLAGGGDSVLSIEAAQSMAAQMPNGRVTEINGAGRLSPVESPEEVSKALRDFWADTYPAR